MMMVRIVRFRGLVAVLVLLVGRRQTVVEVARAQSPTVSPTPYVPAPLFRDQLLSIAKGAQFRAGSPEDGFGVFSAWRAAFPGIVISGSSVEARSGSVSIYLDLLDAKNPESPANPSVLAFAVLDSIGNCQLGAINGLGGSALPGVLRSPTSAHARARLHAMS